MESARRHAQGAEAAGRRAQAAARLGRARAELAARRAALAAQLAQAAPIAAMVRNTALGTGEEATATLRRFQLEADADELIMAVHGTTAERVQALELLESAGALGDAT